MLSIVVVYLLFGLLAACLAWSLDASPFDAKLRSWPVLVFIVFVWPLWLLMYLWTK